MIEDSGHQENLESGSKCAVVYDPRASADCSQLHVLQSKRFGALPLRGFQPNVQRIIEQIRAYNSKHKRRPPLPNPVLAEQVSERKDL